MADNVEHMMLEHLKRFQATLEHVEAKLDDLTVPPPIWRVASRRWMQHLANLSAADAAQQVSIDNINRRLDRIERRLELAS